MRNKIIVKLKKLIKLNNLDGYIIPKNDAYFSEFSSPDRLKIISNFDGSAGFAIILEKKNYLFVDGRYSIQAKIQSGKYFEIIEIPKLSPIDILKEYKKKLILGFDPQLFTDSSLKRNFKNVCNLLPITENLIDQIYKDKKKKFIKPFYNIDKKILGESVNSKINKLLKKMKLKNIENIFISAPENVAWLLNLRGKDSPHSPIPNCKIILTNKKCIYFFSCPKKIFLMKKNIIYKNFIFCTYSKFSKVVSELKGNNFSIDSLTCSILNKEIISSFFKIKVYEDPCYLMKAIKNKSEIKHMINAHLSKMVLALTKFIFWIKKISKKRKVTEIDCHKTN